MVQPKSPWLRFSITVRTASNASILDVVGPLGMGDAPQIFRDQIGDLLRAGTKNFAINLAAVPYADSSGVGALVGAHTSVEAAGGKCKFFAVPPRVMQLLEMTRVNDVLAISKDEASALSSF